MIHSLSGGVISDNTVFTFAKVQLEQEARWYIAPFPVSAGDHVLVPYKRQGPTAGIVIKTEIGTAQTAPVSVKYAREIYVKL